MQNKPCKVVSSLFQEIDSFKASNLGTNFDDMSSSSDASVSENLEKLRELFSGRLTKKPSNKGSTSPPRPLLLVKGKTTQLDYHSALGGAAA